MAVCDMRVATLSAMSSELGFLCSCCDEWHDGPPLSFGTPAPAYWQDDLPDSVLTGEQCVIEREHFFVCARLVLPVRDAEEEFEWGVWVSLSRANFVRMTELWTEPSRVDEPPYFGWLSTELPYEPSTLNLKTMVHSRPVGIRPTVELEPTDHPLAVEQRTGITMARVREIAERLMHPS